MLKTITIISILTLLACSSNQTRTDGVSTDKDSALNFPVRPLLIEGKDEGWGADIRLSFTEKLTNDTSVVYKVNSTYDNKNIGFEISVPKKGLAKLSSKGMG
jgi:hypothetical protein